MDALIHPRIRERLIGLRRQEGRRRLWVLLASSGVVVAVVAVVALLHSPLLRVERVRVAGARRTSVAAIVQASRLDRHPLMLDVDGTAVARRRRRLGGW